MSFKNNQWYMSKNPILSLDDPFACLPYTGVMLPNGDINFWQYGVHTSLPRFASPDEFADFADLESPMTPEEVKEFHDNAFVEFKSAMAKRIAHDICNVQRMKPPKGKIFETRKETNTE